MDIYKLDGINIELTTKCPLRCPQCYCTLEGGKDIPLDVAITRLTEAARMGATHVELSGGETLCYPHLTEVITAAHNLGLPPSIAISGWRFDENTFDELVLAGLDMICVSLNGPIESENAKSRDGYDYAIRALELLRKRKFENTLINWVMHKDSVPFFPDMIKLAERYQVGGILIIDPKPTSANELTTYPTKEQMQYVASIVKSNKSSVDLIVQHCFSPLLALCSDNKLWGNSNRGLYKGCTAGVCSCCIDVDGYYTPCRHLNNPERWDSLKDYWRNSEILKRLRNAEEDIRHPCNNCRYGPYCRHCLALNAGENKGIYIGHEMCNLWQKE